MIIRQSLTRVMYDHEAEDNVVANKLYVQSMLHADQEGNASQYVHFFFFQGTDKLDKILLATVCDCKTSWLL